MRNLPVDVARELCADIVIAVWLTTPQPKAEEVSSALSIVGRSLDVVIRANERTQIEQLGPDDVGIEVAMNDIGTADFDRTPDAIALGRAAAEASRDTLARFVVSEAEYRAWRAGLEGASPPPQTLGAINIVGLGRVSEEFVEAQLQSSTVGGPVESEAIEDDAERIYALGDFERVEYRMSGPDDDRVLEILPVEKSWGPDYLRLNIGASTDSSADILGILRLDHTRTWVNARGGQWHSAVQIGGQSLLASDFYQPLDARHRFFVQPMAGLESSREDLYLDGDRIARYFVRDLYLQLDGGLNVGSKAQLRLGIRRGAYEVDRDTGLPTFPETDPSPDTSLRLRAIYDTRDSVSLPTRGAFASVRYIHAMDWLNGKEDYDLLEGVLQQAVSLRGNSLSLVAGGGRRLSGTIPVSEDIKLGGVRTFPGLRSGELRGSSYWYAGAIYRWRLLDIQPVFNQTLYAGLRLQAGEMRNRIDGVDDGTLYGIAGSISGRTPLGPFELSLGFVDNGSRQLQFSIGRPVAEGSILDELN